MLKLFNHSIFPHKGHPTRSAHPPMNIHNIQCMNVGVIQYMTMDELKLLSIPSEMLKFFNHSSFPRRGHPTRSLHLPMNIQTCTSQCIFNIINIPFQYHSQHKHHQHETPNLAHSKTKKLFSRCIEYSLMIS